MADSYIEEDKTISAAEGCAFYAVSVEILTEDSNTGKIKKVKEEHLVEGHDCTEVERKVTNEMKGTMSDWKITNMKVSKITYIY